VIAPCATLVRHSTGISHGARFNAVSASSTKPSPAKAGFDLTGSAVLEVEYIDAMIDAGRFEEAGGSGFWPIRAGRHRGWCGVRGCAWQAETFRPPMPT
jgi:hypothetical protein